MPAELVDSERFTDDVKRTKLVQYFAQTNGIEIVDFKIPVFGLCAHQRVAYTTTNKQSTATSIVNRL